MLHSKGSQIQCAQFMPSQKVRATTVVSWLLSRHMQDRLFCSNLNTSNRRAMRDPFQSSPMVKCSGRPSDLGSPGLLPAVSDMTWWVCSGVSFFPLPGSCFLSCSHCLCSWHVHAQNVVCCALRRGAENKTEQKPQKEILYLHAGSRWKSQSASIRESQKFI